MYMVNVHKIYCITVGLVPCSALKEIIKGIRGMYETENAIAEKK
jgi:hypothetical protein